MTDKPVQVTVDELSKHNTQDDCWVAVHSDVWDLTDFLKEHPGGPEVLLRVAGRDGTAEFDEVHAPGMIEENLPADKYKGKLETLKDTLPAPRPAPRPLPKTMDPEKALKKAPAVEEDGAFEIPPLESLISAADFEQVASHVLTPKTWAFYSSAATDLNTHHQNKALLRRVMVQPRILRDVSKAHYSCSILGCPSSAPFFISPAAMARLAHPDGEQALARAAGAEGIIQSISSNASYPLAKIVQAGLPGQPFFLQLYVNREREKTVELLHKAHDLGVRAILVTVDAPVPGKREADERISAGASGPVRAAISGATATSDKKGGGLGRLMGQYIDKALTWADLAWIREASGGLPLVLKGVQSIEDARLAVQYGVDGIFLSNHGGRSIDTAQPAILDLLELRLRCPEIFSQLEVLVDGGFERGLDILKAIALGATAVGIGRPYLYSLVYGQEGAEHLTQILKDEVDVSMRLCGLTSLDQLGPEMLNTTAIEPLLRDLSKFRPIPARAGAAKL